VGGAEASLATPLQLLSPELVEDELRGSQYARVYL
jgi:hypothetical protein